MVQGGGAFTSILILMFMQRPPVLKSSLLLYYIGRRVAELELYVLMAKIIPRYVLSTNLKEMQVKRFNFLTPRKPVHLKFTPRHAVN